MAWYAVDKDGNEFKFKATGLPAKKKRGKPSIANDQLYKDSYYDIKEELPKGTIQKITGKKLSWGKENILFFDTLSDKKHIA